VTAAQQICFCDAGRQQKLLKGLLIQKPETTLNIDASILLEFLGLVLVNWWFYLYDCYAMAPLIGGNVLKF